MGFHGWEITVWVGMFQKTLQEGCLVFWYVVDAISGEGEFAYTTMYVAQIHQI